MARKSIFDEEKLLEAVMEYSNVFSGKIKATELAIWARENIPGLEDVRSYHFLRPVRLTDSKTGKVKEVDKLCKVRMDEINENRSITASIKSNLIFSSISIDEFFRVPVSAQRNLIKEARAHVQNLTNKLAKLTRENEMYRRKLEALESMQQELYDIQADLKKEKRFALNQAQKINFLLKVVEEDQLNRMLDQMGFSIHEFDLSNYKEYVNEKEKRTFDFQKLMDQCYHSGINFSGSDEEFFEEDNCEAKTESLGSLFLIE